MSGVAHNPPEDDPGRADIVGHPRMDGDQWEEWMDRRVTNLERGQWIILKAIGVALGVVLVAGIVIGWAIEHYSK